MSTITLASVVRCRVRHAVVLAIAMCLLSGVLAATATASQTVPNNVKRIFALENANLDIDGVDDHRVDANVAIFDNGVDLSHPDLNIAGGLDCMTATYANDYACESDSPDDGNMGSPSIFGAGHGTWAALDIAAIDNGIDIVGVAPGARIWSVSVAPADGYERFRNGETQTMNLDAMLGGIKWIIATRQDSDPNNDIDVMLTGVGASCPYEPNPKLICPGGFNGAASLAIEDAIADAAEVGIVVVASTGNWNQDMAPLRFFTDQGEKNYIVASSMVDTDGLPGGLGPDGQACGVVYPSGSNIVPDDFRNPGAGWGEETDVASPGACGSGSRGPVAGAAALLASSLEPDSRADVDTIRETIIDAGNLGWTDDSGDGEHEPLLDVGDEGVFDPATVPGKGIDTIGMYWSTLGVWQLRDSNTSGTPNHSFGYWWSTLDIPVTGDWDGDGDDTIAMYWSNQGNWQLRNSNSSGSPDSSFAFGVGLPEKPVAGDWNGDGIDTIGTYNPHTGTWRLRNSNSAGAADHTFTYQSSAADLPVTGDWNGDGIDTIGTYDPTSGMWRLRDSNSAGAPNHAFAYWWSSLDIPVTGDWNGDGIDTVGVYWDGLGWWKLRDTNSSGTPDHSVSYWWSSLDMPVTGDWDGQ